MRIPLGASRIRLIRGIDKATRIESCLSRRGLGDGLNKLSSTACFDHVLRTVRPSVAGLVRVTFAVSWQNGALAGKEF